MSLDGFIAGPDDAMDLHEDFPETNALADDVRDRTAAIVAGRRWHDLATERWDGRRGIYGGSWDGPVFVVTHRPPPPDADPGITFVHEGVAAAVATAAEAAAGKAVGIFGADIARQALELGLIGEIVVHVAPLLLGDGVRFHDVPGGRRIRLDGPVTDLRFRV
jgi:dihydrofolate reductase